MKLLILDVGYGEHPKGDINLDVGLRSKNSYPAGLKTKANIIADAHHLPFRPQSFRLVMCTHVLEHLKSPREALREFNRVGEHVAITVPHKWCPNNNRNLTHKWSFTDSWFHSLGYRAIVNVTYRRFGPILIPFWNEVIASC